MREKLLSAALTLVLSGGLAMAGPQKPATPAQMLAEIEAAEKKAFDDAETQKTKPDFKAIFEASAAKARAYVEGVDPATVTAADAGAWARLFATAGRQDAAVVAARRHLAANPAPAQAFETRMLLVNAYTELKDAAQLRQVIGETTPSTVKEAQGLAMTAAHGSAYQLAETEGPAAAAALLESVEKRIPYDKLTAEADRPGMDRIRATLAASRAGFLADAGRKDEALRALDEASKRLFAPDGPATKPINAQRTQLMLTGEAAPRLAVERAYGAFKGLEDYKGKVVLLDFFAHWCGPCIAAFPEMKAMYKELRPKGLEIVGVTTYYGFYEAEQELARDVEYGKMKEFIAKHDLPWPVAYGERANFESYGVAGIPHVVLVDRKGVVHWIKVGYSEEGMKKLRSRIEKLLAES
jgi:thiol-disulfide isomerase/thioredoxin